VVVCLCADLVRRGGSRRVATVPKQPRRLIVCSAPVGSALDNAASEAFNSVIKSRVRPPAPLPHRAEASLKIATWIVDFHNTRRRHSACDGMSPIDYEHFMAEARHAQAA
jgi:transposase InsO family protein